MLRRLIAISILTAAVMGPGSALAGKPGRSQYLAKADYVAKADAICASEGKLIAPYARRYAQVTGGKRPNYGAAALALSESNAVRSASLAKLKSLSAPVGARSKLAGIWNTFDRLITDTDEVAVALGGNDTSSVAYFDADAQLTAGRYQLLAKGFGFKVCGAPGG